MSTVAERLKVLQGHLKHGQQASYFDSPKRFRFTLDNPRLTEEQRIFYEHNGYIVFKNLVPHHLLDGWSQHFRDICDGKVGRGQMMMMKDISLLKSLKAKDADSVKGERLYNKIQDVMWDEEFFKYIALPEIVDIVKCFTGPNIMAIHTMVINKPPDTGSDTSRHPLHQDLHYFPIRPADHIVCSWTAMEQVTRENGCLVVLPGSHRGSLYPHEYPQWEGGVNFAYHGVVGFDGHGRVHLTMDKGFRKAISCHYAASECNYIDVKGTTQDNIATEVEAYAMKKNKTSVDYKEIFHIRARLVNGKEVNI